MNKNTKNLNEHLLDAMLEISESDATESAKMLKASGMDVESILSRSLNKIKEHDAALAEKNSPKVSETVANRIIELLKSAPKQTDIFLKSYFNTNVPTFQYQSRSMITPSMLTKIEKVVDLEDLEKKLNEQKLGVEKAANKK